MGTCGLRRRFLEVDCDPRMMVLLDRSSKYGNNIDKIYITFITLSDGYHIQ